MSDTAIRRGRGLRSPFSRALAAGPLRLAGIAGVAAALIGTIAWATMHEGKAPPESRTARQPPVNTLPGGVNSTPYQARHSSAEVVGVELRAAARAALGIG